MHALCFGHQIIDVVPPAGDAIRELAGAEPREPAKRGVVAPSAKNAVLRNLAAPLQAERERAIQPGNRRVALAATGVELGHEIPDEILRRVAVPLAPLDPGRPSRVNYHYIEHRYTGGGPS